MPDSLPGERSCIILCAWLGPGCDKSEVMTMKGLTPKQEKFVQGLFKGLSQREAYKQAYNAENMKDNTIDRHAYTLASDDKIKTRLKELQLKLEEQNIITVGWVLNNLKEVAERCMQAEAVTVRSGNQEVETGEYTFQAAGANKALELIGKHLGMFTDNIKLSGSVNNPFEGLTEDELRKLANK
jgi:phage terminase small subunit